MTLAVQRKRWFGETKTEPYHPYSEIIRDLIVDLEQLRDTLIDVHRMDTDLPGAIQLKIDMVLLKTGEGL
jgi:hypothetical protein